MQEGDKDRINFVPHVRIRATPGSVLLRAGCLQHPGKERLGCRSPAMRQPINWRDQSLFIGGDKTHFSMLFEPLGYTREICAATVDQKNRCGDRI